MRYHRFALIAGLVALPGYAASVFTTTPTAMPSAATLPQLPPLASEASLQVPGSGTAYFYNVPALALPGLGTLAFTLNNPGQGNGYAAYGSQLNLNPLNSSASPTIYKADYKVFNNGQLTAAYFLQAQGFNPASNYQLPSTTLPGLGQITGTFDNGGVGQNLTASYLYTSPVP